jgi:hypothetical protein
MGVCINGNRHIEKQIEEFYYCFVREMYGDGTLKILKTATSSFVGKTTYVPICKIVVPLLSHKTSTDIAKVGWLIWGVFELNARPRRLLPNVGSRGSSNKI